MNGIKDKCLSCEKYKEFISYDGVTVLRAQIICYEDDISHYERLMIFRDVLCLRRFSVVRLISKQPLKSRLHLTLRISLCFEILLLISVITFFFKKGQMLLLSMVVGAISLMLFYTFMQLHILDIKKIRVFEVVMDNSSYQKLLSIGCCKENNRVREICVYPTLCGSRHKLHVPIISGIIQLCILAFRIFERNRIIMRLLNNSTTLDETLSTRIVHDVLMNLSNVRSNIEKTEIKVFSYSVDEQIS